MDKIFADNILQGKVAFVTGGGTGITGGIARALADAGAKMAITSRKQENLEPMKRLIEDAGGECFAVAADVRDFSAVENAISETVAQFGKIDIVINGAAGNFLCRAEELSANGFGTVVDIDAKGTFNVCRAAFEELKKSKGQILNISATLHYLATPMQIHVSAAKAGVDAITRNLSVEWGRYGIRVNGIAPGPIATDALLTRIRARAASGGPAEAESLGAMAAETALGRMATAEEEARTALFLASDLSSGITGRVFPVDAGLLP